MCNQGLNGRCINFSFNNLNMKNYFIDLFGNYSIKALASLDLAKKKLEI